MKIEEFMNAVTDFFLGNKGADAAHVRLDRGVLDVAMMIAAKSTRRTSPRSKT